jgi:hypothetical protein
MDFEEWMENTFQEPVWDEGWTRADMKAAWQASRENQQEYQKHEFCRDMECRYLKNETCVEPLVRPDVTPYGCPFTAKGFHHWLKENGYRML